MIRGVRISGFKRFRSQEFVAAPLTILAGLNGSGKTSFIQSLLLAREGSINSGAVRLNGVSGLRLGTALDVRNWQSEGLVEIEISTDSATRHLWKFGCSSDDALYLTIDERPTTTPHLFEPQVRRFSYLSAEREGPRIVQHFEAAPASGVEVGANGEFCAQLLTLMGDKPLSSPGRTHPAHSRSSSSLLKYEVEKWLGQIARPVEVLAERIPGSPVGLLKYRPPGGEWVLSVNMGFGVTYALPIIIAGLTNTEDSVLVVENPEAHLHPAGQSMMGTFLAWLAGRGVQVIAETHSDHILNGVRRAIAEFKYLGHDSALVNYFSETSEGGCDIEQLRFSPRGSVSSWPKGFFDQYQVDVAALGRLRRGG